MGKLCEKSVLEYPTFRMPYEELNRKYRNGHKNIEKSATHIRRVGQTIRNKLSNGTEQIPIGNVKPLFQTLCGHVHDVQKSLEETMGSEIDQTNLIKYRINYLRKQDAIVDSSSSSTSNQLEVWKEKRLRTARYALWYLLRCGLIETAKKMATVYRLHEMIEIDIFEQCKIIEDSLLAGNTSPCLAWIESHRSKLRRMNSRLEIAIRTQDIVDMRLDGREAEGLKYIRKYVVPLNKSDHHDDVKLMVGILGIHYCGKSSSIEEASHRRYAEAVSSKRWVRCAGLFIDEMHRLYQLSFQSVFSMCVQTGLSAHKTPSCKIDERTNKEIQCYVCDKAMWPIANGLPNAHVTQSRILCSMTGEECNESNQPYMFPSGHVYGESALKTLREGDTVKCPETGELVPFSEVHRLFFL